MSNTATIVCDVAMTRRLYKVDPPVSFEKWDGRHHTSDYVVADYAPFPFDTGVPETMVFPADKDGRIVSLDDLACVSPSDGDLDAAIESMGYEVR